MDEVKNDARRFLDLAVFYKCLEIMAKLPGYGKMDPVAKRLAVASTDEFMELSEKFVTPILGVRGFQSLGPRWARLSQPKKTALTFQKRGAFVADLFAKTLSKKGQVLRDMFAGPELNGAKRFAHVAKASEDGPQAEMEALSKIFIMGGMTRTKRYVRDALAHIGIEIDEISESLSEVAEAKELGTQLGALEIAYNNSSPEEVALRKDLAEAQRSVRERVAELAEESSHPEAVTNTVLTEASQAASISYATKIGKKLGLSPAQEEAMMIRGASVIAAGAGSGKTRVLAGKVVYHIEELGFDPHQIIATSFSSKSAYELTHRIRSYGGDDLLPEDALDGFGTTHSVAGKILERFTGMGYGKPGDTKRAVLDGGQQSYLIRMAMEQVTMHATRTAPPMVEEGMFDTAVSQSQGVSVEDDPMTFEKALANAVEYFSRWQGTGGYEGFLHRICNDILRRGIPPERLSEKQLKHINIALRQSGSTIQASEAAPASVVTAAGQKAKSVYWRDPANQWFNFGMPKAWVEEGPGGRTRKIGPKKVQIEIGKWKANLVSPSEAYKQGGGVFAAAYAAYEWLKKNDPQAPAKRDHDDMLIQATSLLISNPSILAQMQTEKKFVMVDEAQDLNKAQHLLFGLISGYYDPLTQTPKDKSEMSSDTYCFIGDDKQAIYEFRGADPNVFIELSTVQGFKTKLLEMNYRSGASIVDAANNLIAKNDKQIPMVCKSNPSRGVGNIQADVVETHEAGAEKVAREIEELVSGDDNGFGASDFGIACRTNAEMHAYCLELSVRGVPFKCPKIQLFNDKTSKALINWLSLPTAKSDTEENKLVLECFRFPNFSLDEAFVEKMQRKARGGNYIDYLISGGWETIYDGRVAWRNRKNVRPYAEALDDMRNFVGSPAEALTKVLSISGTYDAATNGAATIVESLVADARKDHELMSLLDEESGPMEVTDQQVRDAALAPVRPLMTLMERYQDLDIAMDFIHQLQEANKKTQKKGTPDKSNQTDQAYEQPAVQIDTVHGWKGLEASHVYVPMAGGVFPHKLSKGEDEMASERRLAYVAITRGQNSVKIICPKVAHNGKPGGVSEFVGEACVRVVGDDSPPSAEEGSDTAIVGSVDHILNWLDDNDVPLMPGVSLEAHYNKLLYEYGKQTADKAQEFADHLIQSLKD